MLLRSLWHYGLARPTETPVGATPSCMSVPTIFPWPSIREAVITAYGGRCAVSRIPEPLLLDAAHIIEDKDERLGQLIVTNGIPLSKLHHAAFDAHLIGIDPDYRLHVSDRLVAQHDGSVQRMGG